MTIELNEPLRNLPYSREDDTPMEISSVERLWTLSLELLQLIGCRVDIESPGGWRLSVAGSADDVSYLALLNAVRRSMGRDKMTVDCAAQKPVSGMSE